MVDYCQAGPQGDEGPDHPADAAEEQSAAADAVEEEGGHENEQGLDEADSDCGDELHIGRGDAGLAEDLRAVEDDGVDARRLLEEVDAHAGDQNVPHRRCRVQEQLPPYARAPLPLL